MKNQLIYTATILFVLLLSTQAKAQTTLEEYNYVTKGYKVQVESGLDMKKGYQLIDIDQKATSDRTASLKKLVKVNSTDKKTVAYMIIYSKTGGVKEYICVPHPDSDSDIKTLYWKALYDGPSDASYKLQLIAYLLSDQLKW